MVASFDSGLDGSLASIPGFNGDMRELKGNGDRYHRQNGIERRRRRTGGWYFGLLTTIGGWEEGTLIQRTAVGCNGGAEGNEEGW